MINLQLTNTQAIALNALLSNLPMYASQNTPIELKQELLSADAKNQELKDISEKVILALLEEKRQQEERAGMQSAG